MPFGISSGISAGEGLLSSAISGKAAENAAKTEVAAAQQVGANAQTAATAATGDVNAATSTANAGITASNTGLTAAQNQELANLSPYTTAGANALNPLQADIASETNPANAFSFTPQQFQQNPQYAFELQQQEQALQQSAAARGGANTGGAAAATEALANNLTSTNYGSAFNQALQSYTTNRQNTLNQIAGYQNLVGTGLSATNSGNSAIQNTAGEINANNNKVAANQISAGTYAGNTGLQAAQIAAQALTGGANASAAGQIGVANAAASGINSVGNALGTYSLYSGLGGLNSPYNIGGYNPNANSGVTFGPGGTMTVNGGGGGFGASGVTPNTSGPSLFGNSGGSGGSSSGNSLYPGT